MTKSRWIRAIVYAVGAGLLLALSVHYQLSMRTTGGLESGYFHSLAFLFVSAVAFLGTGVYMWRDISRRRPAFRSDARFLLLTGLAGALVAIGIIVGYGGVETPFEEAGFTAASLSMLAMSVLPLPPLVRGAVLALGRPDDGDPHRPLRLASRVVCALTAAAYLTALIGGGTWRVVRYADHADYSSAVFSGETDDGESELSA